MTIKITARQADVWRHLAHCALGDGTTPTTREIGAALGMKNTQAVVGHLQALARKGYISLGPPKRARGLRLLKWPPAEMEDYGEDSHLAMMERMLEDSAVLRTCEWCSRRALSFGTAPRCRAHA